MVQTGPLKASIASFQASVKKLGDSVNKSQIQWNDPQFENMSAAIKSVASMSKQVLQSATKCLSAINRFINTESEQ